MKRFAQKHAQRVNFIGTFFQYKKPKKHEQLCMSLAV